MHHQRRTVRSVYRTPEVYNKTPTASLNTRVVDGNPLCCFAREPAVTARNRPKYLGRRTNRRIRMTIRTRLTIALVTVAIALPVASQPTAIAVLDLAPVGVDSAVSLMASERLRNELVNSGRFTVVERGQVDAILREQGFQQTGCTSTECAVEAGQLLGVKQLVVGRVGSAPGMVLISARIVDVAKGSIVASADDMSSPDVRSALSNGVARVVTKLLGATLDTGDTVFVSDAPALIAAIKSNATVALAGGTYNISGMSKVKNPQIRWINNYDGRHPVITGVKNLTLTARPGTKATVVIDPKYGWVLEFRGGANITVENLTFGHTTPGQCLGGVLRFASTRNVAITGCDLYGSGTYGLGLDTVGQFSMRESTIRECTYGLMEVRESKGVRFTNSTFARTREFTLASFVECTDIGFSDCVFSDNTASQFFSVEGPEQLRVERCRFVRNDVKKFIYEIEDIALHANEFTGNTFTDHTAAPAPDPRKPPPEIEDYLRARYPSSFTQSDRVAANPFGKRCMEYCEKRNIVWSRYFLEHVALEDSWARCFVQTADGGALIVGTLHKAPKPDWRTSTPVVVKLDASFNTVWERILTRPSAGFKSYEGGGAALCDGGYVVYIEAYYHPSMGGVGRLHRFTTDGTLVWERQLAGKGATGTPFPREIQVRRDCSISISGHIYPTVEDHRAERAYNWFGSLDNGGRLVRDSVGGLVE